MIQRLTPGRKTLRIIATLFLAGFSLLFSSCAECRDNPFSICNCCTVEISGMHTLVVQYLDCNGDIKSTRVGSSDPDGENPKSAIAKD